MSITTTEQMENFLRTNNIPHTTLTPLTGGNANYVYRMTSPNAPPSIIKHAEPYVRSLVQLQLPTSRMDNEHTALTWAAAALIPPATPSHPSTDPEIAITVPTIHRYFPTSHVLLMTDSGPLTLKQAYPDPVLPVPLVGANLGRWLAALHASTRTSPFPATFDTTTAKTIYRYTYTHLAETLVQYGHAESLGREIDDRYGALLATDDECICHGDFWPGNVIVGSQEEQPRRRMSAAVVDWEMVRRGNPATDVGQFAAEAWLLDRFKGGRGLLRGFLGGYGEGSGGEGRGEGFEERVAVQMGVHLAFWPTRVEWGSKEETEGVVAFGVEMLKHVLDGDVGWVREEVWKGML